MSTPQRSSQPLCFAVLLFTFSVSPTFAGTPVPDWKTVEPEKVGLDASLLRELDASLPREKKHRLHGLLVVRRGHLAWERYWNGHGPDDVHDLRSVTKSITSLLTGIAIDQGHLAGVDVPVLPFFASTYPNLPGAGDGREQITVEHLLTMRSGLACHDRDRKSPGQEDRMYRKRDWIRHFLELPMAHPPGRETFYCTGGVVALGGVIERAVGRPFADFARESLFGPLGVRGERWSRFDRDRQVDTGGHLYLRPRDLAKIGQLVLQKGEWQGKRLVSAEWIEKATDRQTRIDGGKPYGYLWWMAGVQTENGPLKTDFASGNGGQYLFVIPDLDLVVVFTGGNYNSPEASQAFELLGRYIVPAALGKGD